MRLFPGDEATAMTGAIAEAFPDAAYQRRTVHFCRNVAWRRGNRLQATLEILRGEGREDSTPPLRLEQVLKDLLRASSGQFVLIYLVAIIAEASIAASVFVACAG